MRKALVVLIALCAVTFGLAMGASARPDTTYSVSVKIPFGFYAGDQWMPAGKYFIDMSAFPGFANGSLLRVSSQDGSICQYLLTMRIDGNMADTDYHVTFTKYGESYFLAKVTNGDLGAQAAKSRAEKRLASEHAQASGAVTSVEVVAAPARAK
jgi:hypothetical protein